jgi:hypothetical protein
MKQVRNQQDAGRKLFINPENGGDTATTRHYIPDDKILNIKRYYKKEERIILVVTEKTGKVSILTEK